MAGAPDFLKNPLYSEPVLEILRQPQKRGYRFRYSSEGLTHGGIRGEPKPGEKEGRIYPTIKLSGHRGLAKVLVSIVTADDNRKVPAGLHAHSLIVDKKKTDGYYVYSIDGRDPVKELTSIAIQHVVKDDVNDTLMDRILQSRFLEKYGWSNSVYHPDAKQFANLTAYTNALKNGNKGCFTHRGTNEEVVGEELENLRRKASELQKTMAMNKCRLSFQVFLKGEDGHFSKKLDPVYSDIIYDGKTKHGAALKIMRISKVTSTVNGDEEVWLIADKLQSEDLEVRFFEEDTKPGQQNEWEAFGKFQKTDVLKQICLIFRTPEYHDKQISQPVNVKMQLRRKSDPECISDPQPFKYTPIIDRYGIGEKRRKELPMDEILGFTQTFAKRPCMTNFANNMPNIMLANFLSQQQRQQQPQLMMHPQINDMHFNSPTVTSSALSMNIGAGNQAANFGTSTYFNLTNSLANNSSAMSNNLSHSNSRHLVSSGASPANFTHYQTTRPSDSVPSTNNLTVTTDSTVKIEGVESENINVGTSTVLVLETSSDVDDSQVLETSENASNSIEMFANMNDTPSESLVNFINNTFLNPDENML